MRLVGLTLVAALAMVAAGCGASDKPAAGGAEIVPASAPAFVSVDSNLDSDQWEQVEEFLRQFPDGDQLIRFVRASFEEDQNLSWTNDVKPALGDEVHLVWLDFKAGGANVVAITQPKDEDKFRSMVEKGNKTGPDNLYIGEVSDWFVVSAEQAKVDRFKQLSGAGEKLADDELFKDAQAELPEDNLVSAFVRGKDALNAFEETAGVSGFGSAFGLGPNQTPQFIAAAIGAKDQGMLLRGLARAEQAPPQAAAYKSKLLENVPRDAVAFATFRGGEAFDKQFQNLRGEEGWAEALKELEQELGIPFERLGDLFEDEVAIYVRPQTPLPEFTMLLEAADEEAALRDVNRVVETLTREVPAQPCHIPLDEGASCTEISGVAITRGAFDGMVVITTSTRGLDKIRAPESPLSENRSFSDARKAAGLPDENQGFIWVDLEELMPMILGLASAAEESVPPEVRRNLEPLSSFVAWWTIEDRTSSFELFLGID